jgi:hypothetical protein
VIAMGTHRPFHWRSVVTKSRSTPWCLCTGNTGGQKCRNRQPHRH